MGVCRESQGVEEGHFVDGKSGARKFLQAHKFMCACRHMLQKLGQINARESVLDEGFDEEAVQGQANAAEEQVGCMGLHGVHQAALGCMGRIKPHGVH